MLVLLVEQDSIRQVPESMHHEVVQKRLGSSPIYVVIGG